MKSERNHRRLLECKERIPGGHCMCGSRTCKQAELAVCDHEVQFLIDVQKKSD
jgi:hypothetical protein